MSSIQVCITSRGKFVSRNHGEHYVSEDAAMLAALESYTDAVHHVSTRETAAMIHGCRGMNLDDSFEQTFDNPIG